MLREILPDWTHRTTLTAIGLGLIGVPMAIPPKPRLKTIDVCSLDRSYCQPRDPDWAPTPPARLDLMSRSR